MCVCVFPACVAGSRSLLKLSQPGSCWEHGRNWERCRRRSGVGGCSDVRITAVRRPETGRYSDGRITGLAAIATFDNLYRKCYNKCNDNNKNVISHQTGKNASVRRFFLYGYKIPLNRQKRRTTNLHKIW